MYTYTYAVADDYSGSNFGADEQRDGPVASGSYYVNLPDSRVQKVNTPVILCNFYVHGKLVTSENKSVLKIEVLYTNGFPTTCRARFFID